MLQTEENRNLHSIMKTKWSNYSRKTSVDDNGSSGTGQASLPVKSGPCVKEVKKVR
jgi:hypothetical protein